MRITGGELARRTLHAPPGLATRPTADKVRQALFNIIGPLPAGARVLDLFAGTGALGIEALSHGAALAVFVEEDPAALATLRRNLRELRLDQAGRAEVRPQEVFRCLAQLAQRGAGPFDLVLADPPYRDAATSLPRLLEVLGCGGLLTEGATVVVEFALRPREPLPLAERYGRLRRGDERVYGQTGLAFYVATGGADALETPVQSDTDRERGR